MANIEMQHAVRHISLPNDVTVRVETSRWQVELTCRGTIDALLASGYLTQTMISARKARKRGSGNPQLDENGGRFWMQPSPSKASPERMMLVRRMSAELAIQLPGVRELFPEGIPELLPENCNEPEKERSEHELSRADFCTGMLDVIMQCVRGDHPTWPETMPAETQCLIEQHVNTIREIFRCDGNKRRAPRPSFLRLVINNKEMDHG